MNMDLRGIESKALVMVCCLASVSCHTKQSAIQEGAPVSAHVVSDGTPVAGAAEPEVVQLRKIDEYGKLKRVTVGNAAGDYVLVCDPNVGKEVGLRSCVSPPPRAQLLALPGKRPMDR